MANVTKPYQPIPNMIIWRPIAGFPRYRVSDRGDVFDTHKNKKLTKYTTPKGYLTVSLMKNGKAYRNLVHRLVMSAFIGENDLSVDHINEIKTDNRLCNLRYLTRGDNARTYHEKRNRWFSGYYDGELIGRWLFQMDAARELNLNYGNIYKCLHGSYTQTGGFTFRYDE